MQYNILAAISLVLGALAVPDAPSTTPSGTSNCVFSHLGQVSAVMVLTNLNYRARIQHPTLQKAIRFGVINVAQDTRASCSAISDSSSGIFTAYHCENSFGTESGTFEIERRTDTESLIKLFCDRQQVLAGVLITTAALGCNGNIDFLDINQFRFSRIYPIVTTCHERHVAFGYFNGKLRSMIIRPPTSRLDAFLDDGIRW